MEKILIPILLILLIGLIVFLIVRKTRKGGACCGNPGEMVKKVPVRDRNKAHYPYRAELQIEGMTCENCAIRVENALNSLDGTWAKVDLTGKKAVLRLKSPLHEQMLKKAVLDAGYIMTEVRVEA